MVYVTTLDCKNFDHDFIHLHFCTLIITVLVSEMIVCSVYQRSSWNTCGKVSLFNRNNIEKVVTEQN